MRLNMFVGLTIGLTLAVTATLSRGDSEKKGKAERIAAVIKQLGDDEFAKRETASKELEALGEPALPALRKARLSDDAEIRRRAEEAIRAISHKVAEKVVGKWEGSWEGDVGVKMTIKGERFRRRARLPPAPGMGRSRPLRSARR